MRTKTVKRHWCDFCNKAGLQAHAMAKHERHCTMNPARDCRVCTLINGGYKVGAERMAELVTMLPDPTAYLASNGIFWEGEESEHSKLVRAVEAAMPKLRAETDNCPACILAALRQRKIPVPMSESFNFKSEMAEVLAAKAREDDDNRGYTRGWA